MYRKCKISPFPNKCLRDHKRVTWNSWKIWLIASQKNLSYVSYPLIESLNSLVPVEDWFGLQIVQFELIHSATRQTHMRFTCFLLQSIGSNKSLRNEFLAICEPWNIVLFNVYFAFVVSIVEMALLDKATFPEYSKFDQSSRKISSFIISYESI